MALGENNMLNFYDQKSIVHSYNFYVDMTGVSETIKPHHVLDVDMAEVFRLHWLWLVQF